MHVRVLGKPGSNRIQAPTSTDRREVQARVSWCRPVIVSRGFHFRAEKCNLFAQVSRLVTIYTNPWLAAHDTHNDVCQTRSDIVAVS